ncbi:arrestin domain-containing protein 3-like [Rhagoletis pomonella]|uniref:arrestin domain-containing protein 3-like n=1 Tax=Rhagoletis pomonella TaxID=28610 RepID=UPI00177B39F1|nr:arrestin domain-containing protein 3-like [Rhagoletis pomonella]
MSPYKFTFERDPPLYMCGEKVVGTAELTLLKERSFEDIRIGFRGMATVRWVDTLTRFPKLYSAEETYMEIETVVFQGGQLLPSTYKYEFDFRVPDVCPTTCTTDIGKIYYELSLLLVYHDKEKRKFASEVMVLQTYNIEKLPNALLPVIRSDEIFFCCWPCAAGPIDVHLKAARAAYIPGNTIEFTIEMTNKSRRCKFRTHVTIYLMQVYKFTTYLPRRRQRYISYDLKSVEKRIIVRSGDMVVVDDQFDVPPLPPSTQGTHIISIKYELRLEMRISAVSQAVSDLVVPIIIGTAVEQSVSFHVLSISYLARKSPE